MNADIDELTRAIQDDPTDAWLYWERGLLYWDARRNQLALDDFGEAIGREPDEPTFWRSRGSLLAESGYASARDDLDRAVELDPEDPSSFALRGRLHQEWRDYDLALADFGRAIALDPLVPDYHRRRALVWEKKGELAKALADFDEAIRLDPEESRYHYERAWALLYRNPDVDPERALPDLDAAIRLQPEAHGSRMDRGYVRYVQRRWSEAAEDFSRPDFRHVYRFSPELGAQRFVWIDLARRFEGRPQLGREAIREYLAWYRDVVASDRTLAEKMGAWPVPLARFLAGEIGEADLLALTDVNESNPAWEHDQAVERRRGCHFVLAEWARAQGLSTQADAHLRRAIGLPAHDPMSWVVAARLASVEAT